MLIFFPGDGYLYSYYFVLPRIFFSMLVQAFHVVISTYTSFLVSFFQLNRVLFSIQTFQSGCWLKSPLSHNKIQNLILWRFKRSTTISLQLHPLPLNYFHISHIHRIKNYFIYIYAFKSTVHKFYTHNYPPLTLYQLN